MEPVANNNQNNYSESMLKGRMAETLVEELLKKSGNTVYRFGYEAIMQNLVQIKKSFDLHSDTGERIRAIPDFIVIDTNGNPLFVEVKFRWNGQPIHQRLIGERKARSCKEGPRRLASEHVSRRLHEHS